MVIDPNEHASYVWLSPADTENRIKRQYKAGYMEAHEYILMQENRTLAVSDDLKLMEFVL